MKEAPSGTPARSRSQAIDALRGLAILTMFAANLAGPCLRAPHPMWLRVYGSFAAPTFVLLAGMMTSLAGHPPPLSRLLRRSLWLLALAVGIDALCWGTAPFETFDVLYLLGLALPLVGLSARMPLLLQLLLAVGIFAATPLLHRLVGYGPLLPEHLAYPWPTWRLLLVDGWFPVFPWVGVALLGGAIGRLSPLEEGQKRSLALVGALLLGLGVLGWWLAPPEVLTRKGYSELFYPVSSQYLCAAIGAVLVVLWLLDRLERSYSLYWLVVLGRSSLLLYVAHVALIALLLDEYFKRQPLPAYLGLYVALTIGLWLLAWTAQRGRGWLRARPSRPTAETGA